MSFDREMSGSRSIVTAIAMLGLAFVSASCTILESVPLDSANPKTCRAAGGVYFLPKKEVRITIAQNSGGSALELELTDNGAVPDRDFAYCLDFRGSPAADDHVVVERSNGLLKSVRANSQERSLDVAESLIDTGLVAVTGNPNAALRSARFKSGDGDKYLISDYVFDPMDLQRLAQINDALALYGYCVFIEGHTIEAYSEQAARAYCDNPTSVTSPIYKIPPPIGFRGRLLPSYGGIAYRANTTRPFFIMRKRDPGRGTWQLFSTKLIEMPNESPIFSIAVDRSAFVTRDTNLIFDNGVLTNVTISKPSEVLEAAKFTLLLAETLASLPAQIVRVRIQAVNNRKAIIDAQNQLIFTKSQYNATVANLRQTGMPTTALPISGSSFYSASVPAPTTGASPDLVTEITNQCTVSGAPNQSQCIEEGKRRCTVVSKVADCVTGILK